jgi:cell shape-determining protein MreC
VFDFLSLFTTTDIKEFSDKVKQYQSLYTEEHLTMEDIVRKKQYVQICSLSLEQSNHQYEELAKTLNVRRIKTHHLQMSKDEVEVWAIEAIASGIIDAKID